jgi:hypothetical protein
MKNMVRIINWRTSKSTLMPSQVWGEWTPSPRQTRHSLVQEDSDTRGGTLNALSTMTIVTTWNMQVWDHVNKFSKSFPSPLSPLMLWPSCGHLLFQSFIPGHFLKSSIPFWAGLVSPSDRFCIWLGLSALVLILQWLICVLSSGHSIWSDQSFPVLLCQFHPLFAYQHRCTSLRLAICQMSL